jgi:hypothetical protein
MRGLAVVGTENYKVRERRRDTAYGIVPIWDYPTSPKDFYVWTIPANTIFPFRPFLSEVLTDPFGKVLSENERLPDDQVTDLIASQNSNFIYLSELRNLPEQTVERIVEILTPNKRCSKYPVELKEKCITCWINYLDNEVYEVLEKYNFDSETTRVIDKTIEEMARGFRNAIREAQRRIDIAIREIDDPKSGKSAFYESDLQAIYHTHSERPKYKTTVNEGAEIANVLKQIGNNSTEQLLNMISSLQAKILTLEEKLKEPEKVEAKEEVTQEEAPAEEELKVVSKIKHRDKKGMNEE